MMKTLLAGSFILAFSIIAVDPPMHVANWGAKASAGSTVIGGRKMTCRYGKVVWNNKLPDLGMAARGTIWLNRKLLSKYAASFQQFVFLHECAHQYVWDEASADCWAIKRGVYRGVFSGNSITQICRVMKGWKGGLWHNAGPDRCAGIKRCFKQAARPRKKSGRRAAVRKKP